MNNVVPPTLLTFIGMLLLGSGSLGAHDNQAARTVSQLIVFKAVKRPRRKFTSDVDSAITVRHSTAAAATFSSSLEPSVNIFTCVGRSPIIW
jgi:hypothetical protein